MGAEATCRVTFGRQKDAGKALLETDALIFRGSELRLSMGIDDDDLVRELEGRGARVARRLSGEADVIFYGANHRTALGRLKSLTSHLTSAGALWIIRPKGNPAITEMEVMKAGRAAGLVDVKVARYSDTHTAEKYVVPVRLR